jgi:hypothetical protein
LIDDEVAALELRVFEGLTLDEAIILPVVARNDECITGLVSRLVDYSHPRRLLDGHIISTYPNKELLNSTWKVISLRLAQELSHKLDSGCEDQTAGSPLTVKFVIWFLSS